MTGGQPHDGAADRARRSPSRSRPRAPSSIVVVTDEPDKYPLGTDFAPGVTIRHRDELDAVQRELREIPGLTVLVYDQTCAAEKRRRRKRGTFPDPAKRVFINDAVCEGCGDCSDKTQLRVGQAARDRARPQARDRPDQLQQGLLLPERLLPELRDGAWRHARQGQAPAAQGRAGRSVRRAADADPAAARRGLRHPGHRHRRHRRRSPSAP